ncbi:MAG: hypothetical protein H7246_16165 [Phycisphaerae bacterium]|nr:hypothetical protein [Saprospiraceae bacterium]
MKKLIFTNCILGLALIFSFCSKPELTQDFGTVITDPAASDRTEGTCCMKFWMISSNFQSANICGVAYSTSGCTAFTNSCGTSSGYWQTISNKETFCVPIGQPFMITNTGNEPITFYLVSPDGNSGSACITPYQSISFEYVCGSSAPTFCAP